MEATITKYLKRSPVVLLPALALLGLLISAVLASLLSWTVLYRNVVPNAGKREPVHLQYGSVLSLSAHPGRPLERFVSFSPQSQPRARFRYSCSHRQLFLISRAG